MTVRKLLLSSIAAFAGILLSSQVQAQTLQQAIECAMETNPDILITTNDRLATDQALRVAQAGYLPTLDMNAGYGRQRSLNGSTIGFDGDQQYVSLTTGEFGVHLNQMLFDGFATSDEVARNKFRVTSSAYKVAGTANDTALRVAQVYLGVLQQQQLVALAEDNLDILQSWTGMIQQRTKAGISRSGDLIQAQSRLALGKTNYQNALSNLRDAETDYLDVVGEMPKDLVDPFVNTEQLPPSEQAAVDTALTQHPTLKSAMQDVEAAEAQAAAAHSDDLPQLAIQAGADLNNNVGGLNGPDNAYIAMVRGTYNLFKGGADQAKERETAFLVQESMEVRNKTYREVVRTTRLSWNALESIEAQIGDLKDHSVSAKATVGVYRQQFVLGDRTLLDLLDAQNESFNATTAYITGKYTDLFAKYRVLNAEGNLPQCVNVPLPPESDIVVDP